jgi:ribosomal protein S18 acetylase RimI-like enzyme
MEKNFTIRDRVKTSDIETIHEIVKSTKYFSEEEEHIAKELIEERLQKGDASGYLFNFLEKDGEVLGYSCFGLIPCSAISYDLYWIVVHNDHRGNGYGKYLIEETEKYIKKIGGKQIYVDTSSKDQYKPTRSFYEKSGYKQLALFEDYYDFGDGNVIYIKKV